jgi:hypothetical protein
VFCVKDKICVSRTGWNIRRRLVEMRSELPFMWNMTYVGNGRKAVLCSRKSRRGFEERCKTLRVRDAPPETEPATIQTRYP